MLIAEKIKILKETSRKNGFKLTPQRIAILKEILARRDHPSAEDIYESLKDKIPGISLTTVYRTLSLLESLGFVRKIPTLSETTRYETSPHPHIHFICVKCKQIYDFDEEPNIDTKIFDKEGFKTTMCDIICYGICKNCLKSEEQ